VENMRYISGFKLTFYHIYHAYLPTKTL